jgi:Xaa-Pro aminopeptidase
LRGSAYIVTRVSDSEFRDRLAAVSDRLADTDADAAVWFGATSIEYLTGFGHIQTERPVVLAVTPDRVEITVPRLEVERVETNPRIDAVHHYFDYPGGEPIEVAAGMLCFFFSSKFRHSHIHLVRTRAARTAVLSDVPNKNRFDCLLLERRARGNSAGRVQIIPVTVR